MRERELEGIKKRLKLINEEIKRLLKELEEPSLERWEKVSVAAEELGVTPKIIRSRIKNKEWKEGYHFIDTSTGLKPNYRVNIQAAKRFFQTTRAKRKVY
ncbi:MAG: hypothetical protein SAL07_18885 [Oscillatoria sp. PMC 1051.18]|nr:hypothetical protein [Oscillatoria sp. PMC 1050.18]MEC5031969.1 hypothetical protein [Oscillatoria sp. PMC 1051.18]